MALYNVFVPGYHGAAIDPGKITGGKRLTTEYPVGGTMFYGVDAASTIAAVHALQAAGVQSCSEAMSAFLQSNDTRQAP